MLASGETYFWTISAATPLEFPLKLDCLEPSGFSTEVFCFSKERFKMWGGGGIGGGNLLGLLNLLWRIGDSELVTF